jgi:hypothetical protein
MNSPSGRPLAHCVQFFSGSDDCREYKKSVMSVPQMYNVMANVNPDEFEEAKAE